jgi:tRNA dimethylallyltransferase
VAAPPPPLIAIAGPTAGGKSALGLRLALARGGEIVSCDSQQVYRGLDIGTAKPTGAERRAVRHHLLDVASPDEDFSAAAFARLARASLADVVARGRLPIVVGGTGLYLRALLHGIFAGPSRDEGLRARLEGLAVRHGDARLHRLLGHVDPEAARRIAPRDRVRAVRALEVFFRTGRPISSEQRAGTTPLLGFRVLVVGLDPGRERLREAVVARTRWMLDAGLVGEVRALLASGVPAEARPLHSVGYRQALAVVRGEMSEAEAEAAIVGATMRLAKRQRTWFRNQEPGIRWFSSPDEAYDAAVVWLDSSP